MGTDPARWQQLSPLLDELLELSGNARAERLGALERDDPSIGAELRDLLAREGAVDGADMGLSDQDKADLVAFLGTL